MCFGYSIGSGGAAGNQTANFKHPRTGSAGTTTSVSGLFSLSAGGGGSLTGGGVQGPLASGSGGSAGTISNSGTKITSGQYLNSSYTVQTIGSTSDLFTWNDMNGLPEGRSVVTSKFHL